MSGYVLLHRSLIGHPAFRNDAEAMVFAWMVARAAWKPVRLRYKGRAISLDRGQLAISIRDLADAMDRDKAWIERLFKRLRAEAMIETVSDTGVSIVTVCNYAKYQHTSDAHEAERETAGETDARQTRDTEQIREELKEEITSEAKASSGDKRAARIPADWQPTKPLPEKVHALAAQWPPGRLERELDGFRDYWLSRNRDAARTDWDLTWHNRIRDQHDRILREARNVQRSFSRDDSTSRTLAASASVFGPLDERGPDFAGRFAATGYLGTG